MLIRTHLRANGDLLKWTKMWNVKVAQIEDISPESESGPKHYTAFKKQQFLWEGVKW